MLSQRARGGVAHVNWRDRVLVEVQQDGLEHGMPGALKGDNLSYDSTVYCQLVTLETVCSVAVGRFELSRDLGLPMGAWETLKCRRRIAQIY